MRPRSIAIAAGGVVVAALVYLVILGSSTDPRRYCREASAALVERINNGMMDPADKVTTAFISEASQLSPPELNDLEDMVWVAARVPGYESPAVWLAEASGRLVWPANATAHAINSLGGRGEPGGDGEAGAWNCAMAYRPSGSPSVS
jgi:hypothetical protein